MTVTEILTVATEMRRCIFHRFLLHLSKDYKGLLQILWLILCCYYSPSSCVQLRVPDTGQSRKFLEIYDQRNDKFLGTQLFIAKAPKTKLPMKIETIVESAVKYKSEQIRSLSEYINSFEIGASAKLGATYAGISGGFESSMSIKNELKTEREFILMIIRLTNRTVTKHVDPCSTDFDNTEMPANQLVKAASVGSHVVTGKTYGYSIEITLKVTSTTNEKSKSQQASLGVTAGFACASFTTTGFGGSSNVDKKHSEDISIKVTTKHLSYPYPLPTSWRDVGPFIANVTEHANRNGVIGGVLDYELEELRLIQNCRKGSQEELSVHQVAYEIVLAATETVLQEVEAQEHENLRLVLWFKSVRNCLTEDQEITFLRIQDDVKMEMDNLRARISWSLDSFRNNKTKYTEYVSESRMNLELLFSKALSIRKWLGKQLVQHIEFVAKAASHGYPCIARDDLSKIWVKHKSRNAYYLFRNSEIRYYLDNNVTLGKFSKFTRAWIPSYWKYSNADGASFVGDFNKFESVDWQYIPTIYSLLYFIRRCKYYWTLPEQIAMANTTCSLLDCDLNENLCDQLQVPSNLVGMHADGRGWHR